MDGVHAPDWLVVRGDCVACDRCGARWDHRAAGDSHGGAGLVAPLLAFAAAHAGCAAEDVVPVLAVAALDAPPLLAVADGPRRGRPPGPRPIQIRNRRPIPPGGLGRCMECGTPYNKIRRCFACNPTPIMVKLRDGA